MGSPESVTDRYKTMKAQLLYLEVGTAGTLPEVATSLASSLPCVPTLIAVP